MASLPIVVCGKNPEIAKKVREHLLPEYDVIHIILGPESGACDIPFLLSGKVPQGTTSNLGSQRYSQIPIAIATGGGFDDEAFVVMKGACEGIDGIRGVPWLRPDMTKPRPGQGATNQPPKPDEYESFAEETAKRVKECLGREDVKGDGTFLY